MSTPTFQHPGLDAGSSKSFERKYAILLIRPGVFRGCAIHTIVRVGINNFFEVSYPHCTDDLPAYVNLDDVMEIRICSKEDAEAHAVPTSVFDQPKRKRRKAR